MRRHRRYKRSDLFLVRIWARNSDDNLGEAECEGKVQRVVDGETYQFSDWPTLIDLLVAMTAAAPRQKSKAEGGHNDVQT